MIPLSHGRQYSIKQHAGDVVGSQAWEDGRNKPNVTQKCLHFVVFCCRRVGDTFMRLTRKPCWLHFYTMLHFPSKKRKRLKGKRKQNSQAEKGRRKRTRGNGSRCERGAGGVTPGPGLTREAGRNHPTPPRRRLRLACPPRTKREPAA